ncbi:MAG: serine hydrolase domain-containing protein [Acidimicrobiia bacterium]
MISGTRAPDATDPDFAHVAELLDARRAEDLHEGAQVYVSLSGEALLDTAVGESREGRDLDRDDVMLLYSAGKPLTTVAVLRLWEQGRLSLDDRIAEFVPGWCGGKESATIRHVLTHTGGFMRAAAGLYDTDASFDDLLTAIAVSPAEWEPGTAAGYHLFAGWVVLAAVVAAVDGRRIDTFVREEITSPLGVDDVSIGVPLDEQQRLGDRLAPVYWKGHVMMRREGGKARFVPYRVDERHNDPAHVARPEPGGNARGSARSLGRFYESLLGFGPPLLEARTVEAASAAHRRGMKDRLFTADVPWGLGFQLSEAIGGGPGRRVFGHGGMSSTEAFADPDLGLVVVVTANGLPAFLDHDRRMSAVVDAVYSSLGDEAQHVRRPVQTLAKAWGFA